MPPKNGSDRKIEKGAKFEELVSRIQNTVHSNATITPNEKLIDIHTGQKRQVDVTIRLSDGPTEFLGIVEVRDRSRPVGVRYIEEIDSKRKSVKADAAFIVSKSGYAQTAIKKAHELGIRLLSYEQALGNNWSKWIKCRHLTVFYKKYNNAVFTLIQKNNPDIGITLSAESIATYNNDLNAKILLDKDGKEFCSFVDLIQSFINCHGEKVYDQVPKDGTCLRAMFDAGGKIEPNIFIKNADNDLIELGNIMLEIDLYYETEKHPFTLSKYKEPNSDRSIAEIATANVEHLGKKWEFEMLVPTEGERITKGLRMHVSTTPLEEE